MRPPAHTSTLIVRASAVYMAASGASAAVGLLLLPLLTRFLTPEDFGLVGVLSATVGLLSAMMGCNPSLMLTARHALMSSAALRDLISASIPVAFATAALACLAFPFLPVVAGRPIPLWVYPCLTIIGMLAMLRLLGLTLFQMRHQHRTYALLEFGASLFTGLITLLFVVGLDMDWRGKFLADGIGIAVLGCYMLLLLRREALIGLVSPAALRSFVHYSAPLALHAVALWAINAQDRYFVAALAGVSAAGVYTVAYMIGAALGLVHTAVLRGFNPHFYEKARGAEQDRRDIVRLTYAYLVLSLLGLAVFLIAARFLLPLLLGAAFSGSFLIVAWVSVGYTFNALRNAMTGYLYIADRTRLIGFITVGAAILNALLNFVLIPVFGALGAGVATAATFAVVAAVTTWYAVRAHPMPWRSALGPLAAS